MSLSWLYTTQSKLHQLTKIHCFNDLVLKFGGEKNRIPSSEVENFVLLNCLKIFFQSICCLSSDVIHRFEGGEFLIVKVLHCSADLTYLLDQV